MLANRKTTMLIVLSFIMFFASNVLGDEWESVLSPGNVAIGKKTSYSGKTDSKEEKSVKLSPQEIFKKASPATVTIVASIDGEYQGHGSGFFVKDNGYILTNQHVVDTSDFGKYASYVEYSAVTEDGDSYPAEIVKTDSEIDLALLKIKGSGYTTVELGDVGQVEVGEDVYIIGTPNRLEFSNSIVSGLISGVDRMDGRIQTSAIIHGGNSGGPAFNDMGEVVGVAVATALGVDSKKIIMNGEVQKAYVQDELTGIHYLVPINYAKNLLDLMY